MGTNHHVSPNRLEGSLSDVGLPRLLDTCRREQVTGAIEVAGGGNAGTIELRLGAVEAAAFGLWTGDDALAKMERLVDGTYEIVQRLPDVDGSLGSAAELCAAGNVGLVDVMRHCEEHALSCTITVLAAFDVGTIVYRGGDIADVTLNGRRDEDAIVDMLRWKNARYRVAARPLSLAIDGWPVAGRAKTEPFVFRAGVTDVVPPVTRRRRAATQMPPPPPHRSSWGDLAWNVVAVAVRKLGDRVRARAAAAPPPPVEPAPRPTARSRVRGALRRLRGLLGRRFTRYGGQV